MGNEEFQNQAMQKKLHKTKQVLNKNLYQKDYNDYLKKRFLFFKSIVGRERFIVFFLLLLSKILRSEVWIAKIEKYSNKKQGQYQSLALSVQKNINTMKIR